jgi:endoglucanase
LRKVGEAPGALCEDRVRWLADVRQTAERFGFAWAYFSYDGPFALVRDDRERELDPAVLGALGLTQTASGCAS